jgi:hypothetical protein
MEDHSQSADPFMPVVLAGTPVARAMRVCRHPKHGAAVDFDAIRTLLGIVVSLVEHTNANLAELIAARNDIVLAIQQVEDERELGVPEPTRAVLHARLTMCQAAVDAMMYILQELESVHRLVVEFGLEYLQRGDR